MTTMMILVKSSLLVLTLLIGIAPPVTGDHCTGDSCQEGNHNVYSRDSQHVHENALDRGQEPLGDVTSGFDVALPAPDSEATRYEYPPAARLEPGTVGDVVDLELEPGKIYKRITRAVRPVVFEIPDFLSPEECDYIVSVAGERGLKNSQLFAPDISIEEELKLDVNSSEKHRISQNAWLHHNHLSDEFRNSLQDRLAKLTELPVGIIRRSEPMQVVAYGPAGHYHAHLDSVEPTDLPCCPNTRCGDKEDTPQWSECCRLCRFITVLYYLNDVEAGGETAFPLADMQDDLYDEKIKNNVKGQQWTNLSKYCHNSSLVVAPKKGMAVMWYSHFLDTKGYLGDIDPRSYHGGCDVIKGAKWIANNWISLTSYENRVSDSVFYPDP